MTTENIEQTNNNEPLHQEELGTENSQNTSMNSESEKKEKSSSDTIDYEELLAQEKDKSLRLYAEFENFKKRTQKERLELYKTANKDLMVSLLPVLDDVERAYKEMKKSGNDDLLRGLDLIQTKLFAILEENGLERMIVEPGEDLDTDKHEAITKIPAPTEELKNKIVDCIEVGYLLNGKVIRFAKVVTGE